MELQNVHFLIFGRNSTLYIHLNLRCGNCMERVPEPDKLHIDSFLKQAKQYFYIYKPINNVT